MNVPLDHVPTIPLPRPDRWTGAALLAGAGGIGFLLGMMFSAVTICG